MTLTLRIAENAENRWWMTRELVMSGFGFACVR